jgi:hypothetical protein
VNVIPFEPDRDVQIYCATCDRTLARLEHEIPPDRADGVKLELAIEHVDADQHRVALALTSLRAGR